MQRITVLLAEDHTVVREGIRALVEAEGDIQVIGEASDGREAVRHGRPRVSGASVEMLHQREVFAFEHLLTCAGPRHAAVHTWR